jgi:hypothetical protein
MAFRVHLGIDGTAVETIVATREEAEALVARVLKAARSGTSLRLTLHDAVGEDLVVRAEAVLRLGDATVVVTGFDETGPSTGGAMGISR